MGLTEPKRPVRIANASGANVDPGAFMLRQAQGGNIDAITGDYLAEINLAVNADAFKEGRHCGFEPTALDGISLSLDLIHQKKIKVVLNGGALNPKGLALEVHKLVREKGYDLRVAYVVGDDLMDRIDDYLDPTNPRALHLDHENTNVKLAKYTDDFIGNPQKPIVSARAYLGARAIKKGLDEGADIILCGRVADASPVIGVAQWWHQWSETSYDELAGALVAGHLIECSAYATGANFSGFERYKTEELNDLALPIAEIAASGDAVITKHPGLNGFVTEDIVRCQLLYEIQGNHYANSDVQAVLDNTAVQEIAKDRIFVSGTTGLPPPPTTKLAVFYKAGFQCEFTSNATGTPESVRRKYDILEYQLRYRLKEMGLLDRYEILEFQIIGVPEINPRGQMRGTNYLRVFAQAPDKEVIEQLRHAYMWNGMQHFSGAHGAMDSRTALPKSFLGYLPSIFAQDDLEEAVVILDADATAEDFRTTVFPSGHPLKYQPIAPRATYEPTNPINLNAVGLTKFVALGEVALGRSGDKGANVNLGLFVHTDEEYDWMRTLLSSEKLKELIGEEWKDTYWIERVEFPKLKAVHFVVYGLLSRGISSSPILDGLGKGFADYIRSKYVEVPVKFLEHK